MYTWQSYGRVGPNVLYPPQPKNLLPTETYCLDQLFLVSEGFMGSTELATTDGRVPKIDMVFETDEKAYDFYCLYGNELGFGVRKHYVKRRSSGIVYSRIFCCYKEGMSKASKEANKTRPDARTGCGAHITVRLTDDGRYRVSEFEPNHNHELVPTKSTNGLEIVHDASKKKNGPKCRSVQRRDVSVASVGSAGNCVPSIGMEFADDDEAHAFYVDYAARTGFDVRKNLVKRKASGVVFSRTYCCHKEGYSKKVGKPKPRDRTGCPASLTIKIMKNGKYRVTDFELKHNHALTIKLRWGKGLTNGRCQLLDSAASNRANNAMVGDVGAVLQYIQAKQAEDPAFYYALRLNHDDRFASVFWTDVKSKVEFEYFGDVVTFDTSCTLNARVRPFVRFIGVNHHKQVILFGAALIYDAMAESFEWLFESFKTAMRGKQPKVILTDRSEAISSAIAAVFPGTIHRLCAWQMYNDAAKHLNSVFQGSSTFTKDFSRCLYEIEDEEEFIKEWKLLLGMYDLHSNEWLSKLYEDRGRWCLAYGRETFCADIVRTMVKENTNSSLEEFLDSGKDLLDFFKHYESVVNERMLAELQADFVARQSATKVPAVRMLKQAESAYTPAVFKIFWTEFDMSVDCMVYNSGQVGTSFRYKVMVDEHAKDFAVAFDTSDGTIACSCKKFEFTGIPCRHALKVLDIINIKALPSQCILRRWTKDAKRGIIAGNRELVVKDYRRSSCAERYGSLCGLLDKIAVRAAETAESHMLVEGMSNQLMDQVCKILQRMPQERSQAC